MSMLKCVLGISYFYFFFQAEGGIRDSSVTGVQTCALPICKRAFGRQFVIEVGEITHKLPAARALAEQYGVAYQTVRHAMAEIGRASCREREEISVGAVSLKKKTVKQK